MNRLPQGALRAFAVVASVGALLSCEARDGSGGEVAPSSAAAAAAVPDRAAAGTQAASSAAGLPLPAEGFPLPSDAREGRSADATYIVRWAPVGGSIPELEPFAVAIEVRRADGDPLDAGARVSVDAEMPHHGHGMNLVPEVSRIGGAGQGGDGATRFLASGILLHMPGKWVFAIDVEEAGILERTQWHVEIE